MIQPRGGLVSVGGARKRWGVWGRVLDSSTIIRVAEDTGRRLRTWGGDPPTRASDIEEKAVETNRRMSFWSDVCWRRCIPTNGRLAHPNCARQRRNYPMQSGDQHTSHLRLTA